MSDSVWPYRRQPTRLPHPWDSPGKNTGAGCHFLVQCIKVKVKSLSPVWLLATPWTAVYQAPLSMGFASQEYWSGVPYSNICFQLICELKGMNRERVRWKHGHSNGNRVDEKCLPKILKSTSVRIGYIPLKQVLVIDGCLPKVSKIGIFHSSKILSLYVLQ